MEGGGPSSAYWPDDEESERAAHLQHNYNTYDMDDNYAHFRGALIQAERLDEARSAGERATSSKAGGKQRGMYAGTHS